MSDPTFKLCDICGASVDAAGRLFLAVGTSPCPAGGPSETDFEILDLCDKHKARAIEFLLNGPGSRPDHGQARRLRGWAKESKLKRHGPCA